MSVYRSMQFRQTLNASVPRSFAWRRWLFSLLVLPVACLAAYYLGMLAANGLTQPGQQTPPLLAVNGLYIDPRSLDMGEVWETPQHWHTLAVKNVGEVTRTITDFGTSCDCLGVEPRMLTLPPGGTAELTLSLDLTHRQPYQLGLARWPCSVWFRPVFTGDFAPTPLWELKGVVRSIVSLETPRLAFGDRCSHAGPVVSQKVRARAHLPLGRLEVSAVPGVADVRVEAMAGTSDQYLIIVSPHANLPIGPFKFQVQVRAITADGVAHPCSSIDVTGDMQPSSRVLPRLILLGERNVLDSAEADVTVRLPASDWSIDRIETDTLDTMVARVGSGPDGGELLRVTQRISQAGDYVSPIRILIRKPDGQMEVVKVEVRYHGQNP